MFPEYQSTMQDKILIFSFISKIQNTLPEWNARIVFKKQTHPFLITLCTFQPYENLIKVMIRHRQEKRKTKDTQGMMESIMKGSSEDVCVRRAGYDSRRRLIFQLW